MISLKTECVGGRNTGAPARPATPVWVRGGGEVQGGAGMKESAERMEKKRGWTMGISNDWGGEGQEGEKAVQGESEREDRVRISEGWKVEKR